MADASYRSSVFHIERYQEHVMAKGHELIHHYDALLSKETDAVMRRRLRESGNGSAASNRPALPPSADQPSSTQTM